MKSLSDINFFIIDKLVIINKDAGNKIKLRSSRAAGFQICNAINIEVNKYMNRFVLNVSSFL